MGYFIVIIVGSVLGWLAAIAVERDDRIASLSCASAGIVGGLVGAMLSGDVSLIVGVSATQLLWGMLGAVFMIICVNAIAMRQPAAVAGKI